MNSELLNIVNASLSATVNGVYQGIVLTGIVWLSLKCFPKTNASTRYAVWLATLLIVCLLPIKHILFSEGLFGKRASESNTNQNRNVLSGSAPSNSIDKAIIQDRWTITDEPAKPELQSLLPRTVTFGKGSGGSPSLNTSPTSDFGNRIFANTLARVTMPPLEWRTPMSTGLSVSIILAFLSIVMIRLARLGIEYWALMRIKRSSHPVSEVEEIRFNSLCNKMQIGRKVTLQGSDRISTPIVAGFRQPSILIPARLSAEIDLSELEPILRHELAHVRRWDDWSNLLQQCLKALFFFHPAIWWLSQRMNIDREIACDDHVLETSREPRAYALLLATLASNAYVRQLPSAPAAWNTKSQIKERITMILDRNRNTSTRLATGTTSVIGASAILIALLFLQAAPRLAFADTSSNESSTNQQTETEEDIEAASEFSERDPGAEKPSKIRNKNKKSQAPGLRRLAREPLPPLSKLAPFSTARVPSQLALPGATTETGVLHQPHPNPQPHPVPEPQFPPHFDPMLAPVAPPAPKPPGMNRRGSTSHLEQRIATLERLVESLLKRDLRKRQSPDHSAPQASSRPEDLFQSQQFHSQVIQRNSDLFEQNNSPRNQFRQQERAENRLRRAHQGVDLSAEKFSLMRRKLEAERKILQSQLKELQQKIVDLDRQLQKQPSAHDPNGADGFDPDAIRSR